MCESKKPYFKSRIPSILQVPADYQDTKPGVMYGKIQDVNYTIGNSSYKAKVLLPPNYDKTLQYPALYLLSGMGQNGEWIMKDHGHVDLLIGNLGSSVRDVIVVMPEILRRNDESDGEKEFDYKDLERKFPYLIDYIENTYPVQRGREHRAIAGLSMGGMSALYLSYIFDKTPYGFFTTCAISPSDTLFDMWLKDKQTLDFSRKDRDYNFYLSTGTKDALSLNGAYRYSKLLKDNGFYASFVEIEDKNHEWGAFNPLFYVFFKYFFAK